MQLKIFFLRKTDTHLKLSMEKRLRESFVLNLALELPQIGIRNKNFTDAVENSFYV